MVPTTGWDFRSQIDTRNRKRFGDDVCLLRLQPPGINLSYLDVKPITLAKLPPPSGKRCSIAGWGATYVSSSYRISLNLTTNRPLLQCPLDIETLDKAAALDLATSKAVTDLRQYINSNLGYSDLEIRLLYSK